MLASEASGANVDEVLDSHASKVHRPLQPKLTWEYGPLAEAESLVRAGPELFELPSQAPSARNARKPGAGDGSRKRSVTIA